MDSQLAEHLLDTWQIHGRIHRYLLTAIPDDALNASLTSRGRTVRDLFVHIHNVRLMWLKAAAPLLLEGLEKLDPRELPDRDRIAGALTESDLAIASLISQGLEAGGRIKGFKQHAAAFVGYLISHESHHRGQTEYLLRAAGKPLDDSTSYGLLEWGSR